MKVFSAVLSSFSDTLSPNGPCIFKRSNSDQYWVRFSITGYGQFRIALKTKDLKLAEQCAVKVWYEHVNNAHNGNLVTRRTFSMSAKNYLHDLEREVERDPTKVQQFKDRTYLANRYFIPFFGDMNLGSITSKTMGEYLKWRVDYWFKAESQPAFPSSGKSTSARRRQMKPSRPKPTTLQRENVQLRHFLKYAQQQGYLAEIPSIDLPSSPLNPRPGLTRKEALQLQAQATERCLEADLKPNAFRDRVKLLCYINVAMQSGLRVTEMKNLRWKHINISRSPEEKVTGYAHGKGKSREFVCSPAVIPYLELLQLVFEIELGRAPTNTDPVFATKAGEPLGSFRKSLDALLKDTGLLHDWSGNKRSASCFRHYYITEMKRAGTETDLLALNTGTSPRMIQKNYSKVRAVEERAKLALDVLSSN